MVWETGGIQLLDFRVWSIFSVQIYANNTFFYTKRGYIYINANVYTAIIIS